MKSSYIRLQILSDKGSLEIDYFTSKHDCYFELLGYIMCGCVVLNLSAILFIKSELLCRHFESLCNSEILFHKISDNRILHSSNLIYIRLEPCLQSSV